MIEENQNQYLIPYASDNIGSETVSAERVRKHRANKPKVLHCNNKETKCNTEIDKELEQEKWQKINEILINKQHAKDRKLEKLENLASSSKENEILI